MRQRLSVTLPPFPRLIKSGWDKVLLVVVITAPALAFTWLYSRALRPSPGPEPVDQPGAGIIVGAEVLDIWIPSTLLDKARLQPGCLAAQTHQESQSGLECLGCENHWYALSIRSHQVNGGTAQIIFIRHPYRDQQIRGEFLDILATAAGNPPRYSTSRFADTEVHKLPAGLSEREFREALE